jgi:L-asparagine transporter-like permease/nucleotide-binding universal stress UspA family protein
VFFPSVPIIPVAILVIILFVIMNILGVSNVGNSQVVMGIGLMFAFTVFIIAGFTSSKGFSVATLFPDGRVFPTINFFKNTGILMKTIALIYAAYVGFEVIADDAEEVKNPNKNIPIAILVSLVIITVVYSLTVIVTLGTLPWQTVAGSKTALSDAIRVFMPGSIGVTIIAMAGMIGALTSINSSMLSATRESFTLSRDGNWPLALSRLNRVRVPFMAIIFIGVVSIMITVFGVVDFLSYITSAGYLFVLFFSNLAMITLHKKFPDIHRPFKAPFFPLTPILASLTCVIVIFYSDINAILFTAAVVGVFALYYYGKMGLQLWNDAHRRDLSPGRWRIILPLITPNGADGLMKVGSLLAEAEKDLNMCLLTVLPSTAQVDQQASGDFLEKIKAQRHAILDKFIHYAVDRNVPMYTKMVADVTMADGVINEIKNDPNVKLVLMKWPAQASSGETYRKALKRVVEEAKVSVGVLNDKGIKKFSNIMVPVGGGLNSRLAIHLANDIALQEGSHVDYIRVMPEEIDEETNEDMISHLQEIVMTELGQVPADATLQISYAKSVQDAVINECHSNDYDLIIIGSSDNPTDDTLFGPVCETMVNEAPYSVLVVRRHESASASWLRHQAKRLQRD